jgi:hypothetical protein
VTTLTVTDEELMAFTARLDGATEQLASAGAPPQLKEVWPLHPFPPIDNV